MLVNGVVSCVGKVVLAVELWLLCEVGVGGWWYVVANVGLESVVSVLELLVCRGVCSGEVVVGAVGGVGVLEVGSPG